MNRIFAYKGSQLAVEFAIRSNGESPGHQFYKGLKQIDQAKLLKLFEIIGDQGQIRNREKFKPIEGTKLFEFKSFQIRMPCFRIEHSWVVTHGLIKKTQKIPPADLTRAEEIKAEHERIVTKLKGVQKV